MTETCGVEKFRTCGVCAHSTDAAMCVLGVETPYQMWKYVLLLTSLWTVCFLAKYLNTVLD